MDFDNISEKYTSLNLIIKYTIITNSDGIINAHYCSGSLQYQIMMILSLSAIVVIIFNIGIR